MGNTHAHGHYHPKRSPGRAKRRHSMPTSLPQIASEAQLSSPTKLSPPPNLAGVHHDEDKDDPIPSDSFSCDPLAAMMKHHNRVRQPVSQLFRAMEDKHEDLMETPALEDSTTFNHDSNKSLSFEALNKSELLDEGCSFYEEKSDANLLLMNGNHSNNNMTSQTINDSSMSKSTPMSQSASTANYNHDLSYASMSMSRSGPNLSSSGQEIDHSRRHHDHHNNEKSQDHSRRRSQMLSHRGNKSTKKRAGRRASMDSTAYYQGEKDLLHNLNEVELFLKQLQKQDPEVRQRILMESLQRQAGASRRVLMGDESGGSMGSHGRPRRDNKKQKDRKKRRELMGDGSGGSLGNHSRRQRMGDSSSRRNKSKDRKNRRDSEMSASTSSLLTSTRRSSASDLMMPNKRYNNNNGNLPTLLEQKSEHYHLPPSAAKTKHAKGKASRRSSTGGFGFVPELTAMDPAITNGISESPPKKSRGSMFKKGFRRLSIGDQSKLPAGNSKELWAERERKRSQSPANRKRFSKKSSSMDVSSESHGSHSRRSSQREGSYRTRRSEARTQERVPSKSPKRTTRRRSSLTAWMGR